MLKLHAEEECSSPAPQPTVQTAVQVTFQRERLLAMRGYVTELLEDAATFEQDGREEVEAQLEAYTIERIEGCQTGCNFSHECTDSFLTVYY